MHMTHPGSKHIHPVVKNPRSRVKCKAYDVSGTMAGQTKTSGIVDEASQNISPRGTIDGFLIPDTL